MHANLVPGAAPRAAALVREGRERRDGYGLRLHVSRFLDSGRGDAGAGARPPRPPLQLLLLNEDALVDLGEQISVVRRVFNLRRIQGVACEGLAGLLNV